ncbi:MAG: hypothetical protein ACRD5M_07880 [Candidatus Acidiferrales bacterium]
MKRALKPMVCSCAVALLVVCLASGRAYGDVGVVLNESLDTSVARITGSGHSAVYLSNICAESPVKLRLCRPGELGSVISNYTTLGEDQPVEWNVVPLSIYLYGVEDPQNRPLFGSWKIKRALEERYREKYLSAYSASESCQKSKGAEWREMVGATLERSIFIFVAETTVEQDRQLIADFDSLPNVNHFNGMTRNCADFTMRVVNKYFPRATSTDYLNDFGMTSPKAMARSFTRYAAKHPETNYHVLHFAQVPGTIKRSSEARAGTEQLYHSKKLLVPMLIFADHELPFAAAAYLLTGRFNPTHELEQHPSVESTEINYQIKQAKSEKESARVVELEAAKGEERDKVVGSSEEWKQYRADFDSIVNESVAEEIVPKPGDMDHFFKRLDKSGTPAVGGNGMIWMVISDRGESSRVGLSASNILTENSNPRLAYELILARTHSVLKSPKHSRETMLEFKNDWELLQYARSKRSVFAVVTGEHPASTRDETNYTTEID